MAGNKKHDVFDEESFEHFLDHIEEEEGFTAGAPFGEHAGDTADHPIKRSSLAVLLTKVSFLTVLVVSSVLWFFWPNVNEKIGIGQHDAELEQLANRLQTLEKKLTGTYIDGDVQALHVQNSDAVKVVHQKAEAEKLAQRKAEAVKVAKKKAEAVKTAQKKSEAVKAAKVKAEAAKTAQKKAEAVKAAKVKAEAVKTAQKKSEAVKAAKKKAEAVKTAQKKTNVVKAAKKKAEAVKLAQEKGKMLNIVKTKNDAGLKLFLQRAEALKKGVVLPQTAQVTLQSDQPQEVQAAPTKRQTVLMAGKRFDIFRVAVNVANVRSAPVAGASVVAKLKQGTKVIVFKQEGDWMKIRLHHKKPGWVYHSLLK